jgi:hypothetical protein
MMMAKEPESSSIIHSFTMLTELVGIRLPGFAKDEIIILRNEHVLKQILTMSVYKQGM